MNSFLFEPNRRGSRRTPGGGAFHSEEWNPTQELVARYSAIWKGSHNSSRSSNQPRPIATGIDKQVRLPESQTFTSGLVAQASAIPKGLQSPSRWSSRTSGDTTGIDKKGNSTPEGLQNL